MFDSRGQSSHERLLVNRYLCCVLFQGVLVLVEYRAVDKVPSTATAVVFGDIDVWVFALAYIPQNANFVIQ